MFRYDQKVVLRNIAKRLRDSLFFAYLKCRLIVVKKLREHFHICRVLAKKDFEVNQFSSDKSCRSFWWICNLPLPMSCSYEWGAWRPEISRFERCTIKKIQTMRYIGAKLYPDWEMNLDEHIETMYDIICTLEYAIYLGSFFWLYGKALKFFGMIAFLSHK